MEKLEWSALEYEEKERGNDWFWSLAIIVIAGSVASFIYNNLFFGLLLIIAGVLLGIFAIKKPDMVHYEINIKGLKIRNRLYPFVNIKAFWINKDPAKPTLFIKSERWFMPMITMPIELPLAEGIRYIMLQNKIKEEEMKEHPSEKIMESLGF